MGNTRTRANLYLDNDALAFATVYADARDISLGVAISELIRRAEQTPEPQLGTSSKLKKDKYGFTVLKASGRPPITMEQVREQSEDDLG